MRHKEINTFRHGIIDSIEPQSIPDGAAAASLNFLTKGDRIVLRPGQKLMGAEITGTGKVTGLFVSHKADGTELLWKTYGRKLLYWNGTDFTEVGTDLLPAAASGEDISFSEYASIAGYQTWLSSPNSSLYKILNANPGSIVDQYDSTKNLKGKLRVKQNRLFGWGKTTDKTSLYGSYIDTQTYTSVAAEVLGASGSTTYTGTLAFKGAGAKRTCFAVTITGTTGAGAETFTDNRMGTLTGSLGGTGTVNYATGAYSVTFNGAVTSGNVTAAYQWEDSTNRGIADFTKSATRAAGEGFIFLQGEGGDLQSVLSYGDAEYCFHRFKSWRLNLTSDDTNATNLIYRERVGIPNHRAAVATGEGIYYVDDQDTEDPKLRLLTLDGQMAEVVPVAISNNLRLSDYRFDTAASVEYGDYVIFACRTKDSSHNDTCIFYNKIWKALDKTDVSASCFAIYGGKLLAGDSITNNVYEQSGFDDDDAMVTGSWESGSLNLGTEDMKKVKRFVVEGDMATDQGYDAYLSFDRADYVLVGSVSGTGSYVDTSDSSTVGSSLIGSGLIGGTGEATAYHYVKEIRLRSDKFKTVQVKIVPTGTGYLSLSKSVFWDVLTYPEKQAYRYRTAL